MDLNRAWNDNCIIKLMNDVKMAPKTNLSSCCAYQNTHIRNVSRDCNVIAWDYDFDNNRLAFAKFIDQLDIVLTEYLLWASKEHNFSTKHTQATLFLLALAINRKKNAIPKA